MMEARLLPVWDGLVGAVALIALVLLALVIMGQTLELGDIPRHTGLILGVTILLLILPAILMGLWNAMSMKQHVSIIALGIATVLFSRASRRQPRDRHRR